MTLRYDLPDVAAPLQRRLGARVAMTTVASVACMALVIRMLDLDTVGRTLIGIKPRYAALAFGLIFCSTLVTIVRFRVVLGEFGYLPAWRRLFGAFSLGLIGNQFVFNVIGQSLGRAGALTVSGVPVTATILATLVERILAACLLGVAALTSAWFVLPQFGFHNEYGEGYGLSLAGGMALAAIAGVAVSYRSGAVTRMIALGRKAGQFWDAALLTALAHCLTLGGYFAALLALGVETLAIEVAGCLLIVMFLSALPISLNGWGVREASAVATLGTAGMEPAVAFGTALTVSVLTLGVTLCIVLPGIFLIPHFGFKRISDTGVEKIRPPASIWNARLVAACAALCTVSIFFQVTLQAGGNVQATTYAADVFALAGLVCFVVAVVDSRERLADLPRTLLGVLFTFSLLLACGLVLGYANFGSNSWALANRGVGWLVVLAYAGMGIAVAHLLAERARRLVLRLFVTAGATLAAWQLALLIVSKLGFPPPEGAFGVPLRGYTGNASAFAFQMTMTAAAAVVADRVGALGARRLWLGGVLLLTGLAIYFSSSRTGIGIFVVLLVLSVLFAAPAERRAALATSVQTVAGVALGAVAIVGLPVLDGAFGSGRIRIRTSVLDGDSDPDRWRILVDGWNLWNERPLFGHGLGGYMESQLAGPGSPLVPHSVPLWLMAEMGLIGLVVGLACFVGLSLGAWRMMRTPSHRAWGAGLLTVLLCWGAANLLHDFFYQRSFWLFVGIGFGLLPATNGIRTRWPREERDESKSAVREGAAGAATRRLMIVVTDDHYLWTHRIGLAVAARDAGYEVTVATRVGEYGERLRALGLELVDIDFARGRLSPRVNLRVVRALGDVYRRRAPDLVHHVAIKPTVLGSLAAARTRVPAVLNALAGLGTALTSDHPKARLVRPLLRPALGWSVRRARSHVLVQNPENAKYVESLGVPAERISLVRGAGVDIQRFRPQPEPDGPVRVTMVSRLLRDKGVREFVEAASLVRGVRDDVTFTLVGSPDEENPTSIPPEAVRSWEAEGIVEWWGHRDDVADVLARSHVAVLPSYGEGLPMTLLEAAACGRPIVATDVPGCREVVRPGGNGLLVPARDARALADAILELVGDPARRAAMGAEGRRRAETEFAAERIHAETLRVYERVLAAVPE